MRGTGSEKNPTAWKKARWSEIAKAEGKCRFCPPHGGVDNTGWQPRDDRGKNKRRVL